MNWGEKYELNRDNTIMDEMVLTNKMGRHMHMHSHCALSALNMIYLIGLVKLTGFKNSLADKNIL